MKDLKFSDYPYYPSLRSRNAEMRGYEELPDEDKDRLLPIVTLGKWHRLTDSGAVMDRVARSLDGRPAIIDLTRDKAHVLEEQSRLLDPTNDFENWRARVADIQDVIPVVQITEEASVRQVVRQALRLEEDLGKVIVRIRDPSREVRKAVAVLNAIQDLDNILMVVDLQYVREVMPSKIRDGISTINAFRDVDGSVEIVCMSTSFPRSVASFGEERGEIEILERQLFDSLGAEDVSLYGDHASIHVEPYDIQARGFVPRIDYPLDDRWLFARSRGKGGQGYIDAAREILEDPEWDEGLDALWGAHKIRDAANGSVDRMGSPAPWIAVRVNLHLHRQLSLSFDRRRTGYFEEEEEEEF